MKKKLLILSHSDISLSGGSIGKRLPPILDEASKKYDLTIYSRGADINLKKKYNIYILPIYIQFFLKFLTLINIYLDIIFINQLKNKIISFYFKRKISNENHFDFVHSLDFFDEMYNFLKSRNQEMQIIQDIPIAFSTILKTVKEKEKLWPNKKFILPNYIQNSFQYIDKFIVPSEFVKDSLIKEGIDKNKIVVIPFGVDSNKFKPLKNKSNKTFKLAFSGNVNNRKGLTYLIEAYNELNLKDAELNIYGRVYPEVRYLFKDSKKFNIKVHGFVDLKKELNKNHIFVFPSLLEGSAKSVYEAMSCALPIISTYNAGTIIENAKEGFIIPIQDVKAIKEKILYFYNNRKEIEKFGVRARKKAEKYTWERYGKEVIKNYSK